MSCVAPLGWVGVFAGVLDVDPVGGTVDVEVPPLLVEVPPLDVDPPEDEPEATGKPAGIANGSRTGSWSTGEGARLGDSLPLAPPVEPPGALVVGRGAVDAVSGPPPPPNSLSARKTTTKTPTMIPPIVSVRLSRSVIGIRAPPSIRALNLA